MVRLITLIFYQKTKGVPLFIYISIFHMIRHFVIYNTDQFDLYYYFEYSHNLFYHHKMNRHINESQNHYTMNNEKNQSSFFF